MPVKMNSMDPTGEAMNCHLNYPPVKGDYAGLKRPRRNPPARKSVAVNLEVLNKSRKKKPKSSRPISPTLTAGS